MSGAGTEVGTAYFSLLPTVKGLQGAIAKEVSGIDGHAAGAKIGEGMGGGIAGKLKEIVGPALAIFAADRIKDFAKESVASFSELEDSTAAAGVVFGDSMQQIIDQSKTAGSQLGMSSQQVINAANTFGTYGKAAGLTGSDLAGFSTKLTGLAGDMASFKGTSTEQAVEAVGAALRGETEPIRAYGVMLDDASLRQEALSQGLITTTKDALTPQQKVLAAQALIFKQTADAQGDYARTSLSTANVQKTLSAESENLRAKIGGFLAPAFTAVRIQAVESVRGISGFLDKVTEAQKTAKDGGTNVAIMQSLFGVNSNLVKPFAEGLGAARAFFGGVKDGGEVTSAGLAGGFEGAGIAIHNTIQSAHGSMPAFWAAFKNPDDGVTSSGIAGGFEQAGIVIRGIVDSITPTVKALGPVFGQLGPVFAGLVPQVLQLFSSFSPLHLIFQALLPVLPSLIGTLGTFAAMIGSTLGGVLASVLPVLQQLVTLLVQNLGQIFAQLAPMIITMLGMMAKYFQQLAPVIIQIVGVVVQLAMSLISALMPIIMQLVSAVMPMLVTIFGAVLGAIVPLVTMLADLLIPIIQALLPVVVVVFGVIASVIQAAMQIVMGIIQVVTGIISGNWSQVWDGIVNIFSGVWNLIVSIVSGAFQIVGSIISFELQFIWGLITTVFGAIGGFVAGIWSGIVDGVSGAFNSVVNFFGGLIGRVTGAIGNAVGALWGIGRDIIQGLINGIGSMVGAIGQAILSLVPGPIVGVFKDLLGIHSPSTVFHNFGVNTMEGYINGLVVMKPQVAQTVSGLVGIPPIPSFAVSGSRAVYDSSQGSYGYRGPLVQQDIHPSEGMSEENIGTVSARKIVSALV